LGQAILAQAMLMQAAKYRYHPFFEVSAAKA